MLLNKLRVIRLDNPEQQIKIFTRSPEQDENIHLEEVSVEEGFGDFQGYRNCCVIFDDMMDSNKK